MAKWSVGALRLSHWAAVDAAWRRSLARGVCGIRELVCFPAILLFSRKTSIRRFTRSRSSYLLSNYLDQYSFAASSIEFAVEDLFPWSEIKFALGDRDDHFTAHDLALEMGVSVIFAGTVVLIGAGRSVRRKFFQPYVVIVVQSRFVVVDEYRSGDVHGVHQTKALDHTASLNQFLDFRCDVDEPAPIRYFEPKMFCERFQ